MFGYSCVLLWSVVLVVVFGYNFVVWSVVLIVVSLRINTLVHIIPKKKGGKQYSFSLIYLT